MATSIQCGMLDEIFGTFTVENGVVTLSGNTQALTTLLNNYRHRGDTEGLSDAAIVVQLPTLMRNWYWAKPLAQKYNPYHDAYGRFDTGPTSGSPIALALPAPGTLTGADAVTLTTYMAKNGVTRAASIADGTALMEQSRLAGTLTANADWYNRAASASNALAVKYGLTPDQASGVIAAMSPRSAWDAVSNDGMVSKPNLSDALTIIKTYTTNPDITISPAVVDALTKYDAKTGFSGMVNTTHPFQDFTPQQQSFLISSFVRGYPANTEKALKILGGATPDETLGGPKVRSFYNNIRYPDQSGSVTIDTWMAKLLSGENTTNASLKILNGIRGGNFKKTGAYPYYSDVINQIASDYHIRPHEAQAVMWVQGRINAGGKYNG